MSLATEIQEAEATEKQAVSPWTHTTLEELLAQAWAGTLAAPTPEVGCLVDKPEVGLFYRGKVNGVAGDSGSGKTWVALHTAACEVADGRHVLWVDYEDTPTTIALRLRDLGIVADGVNGKRVHHVSAVGPIEPALAMMDALVAEHDVSLLVIDSVGEGIAGEGRNPNADEDVAAWFQDVPRRFARAGVCVIVLDHLSKAAGGAGLWPIGSQRKRAAIDGAQYVMDVSKPFSRTEDGRCRLVTAKDRGGWKTAGETAADVVFQPRGEGRLDIALWAGRKAEATTGDGGPRTPTDIMEAISRLIEETPGLSKTSIIQGVKGGTDRKVYALELLVLAENVAVETRKGRGGGLAYTVVTPYREPERPTFSSAYWQDDDDTD